MAFKVASRVRGLSDEAFRESETGEYEGGQSDLPAAEPEHRTAHGPEAARLQLEADDEQQEDDAELREMKDLALVIHQVQRPGADDQARQHVAEDRAPSRPAWRAGRRPRPQRERSQPVRETPCDTPFPFEPRPLTRFLRPRFRDPTLSPARAGTTGAA